MAKHPGNGAPNVDEARDRVIAVAPPFPSREEIVICFAHHTYRVAERLASRNIGIRHVATR